MLPDGQFVAPLCGHDGRRGFLYHLAVAETHRRQGLGKLLVDACLARLGKLGVQKCNVLLFDHNAGGRAFWLRRGWSEREDLAILQKATG